MNKNIIKFARENYHLILGGLVTVAYIVQPFFRISENILSSVFITGLMILILLYLGYLKAYGILCKFKDHAPWKKLCFFTFGLLVLSLVVVFFQKPPVITLHPLSIDIDTMLYKNNIRFTKMLIDNDILTYRVSVDFSNWVQIRDARIAKSVRTSPVPIDYSLDLKLLNKKDSFFIKEFYTTGLPPDVSCLNGYKYVLFRDFSYLPVGEEDKQYKRYVLVIFLPDSTRFSTNEQFPTIPLNFRVILWNSFQEKNQPNQWELFIKNTTYLVELQIRLPKDKLVIENSVKVKEYLKGTIDTTKEILLPIRKNEVYKKNDAHVIQWTCSKLKRNYKYKITWGWKEIGSTNSLCTFKNCIPIK